MLPLVRRTLACTVARRGAGFVATRALATAAKGSAAAGAEPLVKYEVRAAEKVGILTLNQPAKLNALSVEMGEQFKATLQRIDFTQVGALVVTGAGKAFSAGKCS